MTVRHNLLFPSELSNLNLNTANFCVEFLRTLKVAKKITSTDQEIASAFNSSKRSVSRYLSAIEAEGLIQKKKYSVGSNRWKREIILSDTGRKVVKELFSSC